MGNIYGNRMAVTEKDMVQVQVQVQGATPSKLGVLKLTEFRTLRH